MKDCIKCEKLLDKALYNELSVPEKDFFDRHINHCGACAKNFEEMQSTLSLVKMHERQKPDGVFMENFWNELEPKLAENKKTESGRKFDLSWLLHLDFPMQYKLAGAALILVLGIIIGRYWTGGSSNINPSLVAGKETGKTALNVETAKYLERSKILLLGLMNFDPATEDVETISLPHIKKLSRQLVNEAPELKAGLKKTSQQQLEKLVSDLQVILLQIANLEASNNVEGIEMVKDGVNSRGIFLKINIQQLLRNNGELNNPKTGNGKVKEEIKKI